MSVEQLLGLIVFLAVLLPIVVGGAVVVTLIVLTTACTLLDWTANGDTKGYSFKEEWVFIFKSEWRFLRYCLSHPVQFVKDIISETFLDV